MLNYFRTRQLRRGGFVELHLAILAGRNAEPGAETPAEMRLALEAEIGGEPRQPARLKRIAERGLYRKAQLAASATTQLTSPEVVQQWWMTVAQ